MATGASSQIDISPEDYRTHFEDRVKQAKTPAGKNWSVVRPEKGQNQQVVSRVAKQVQLIIEAQLVASPTEQQRMNLEEVHEYVKAVQEGKEVRFYDPKKTSWFYRMTHKFVNWSNRGFRYVDRRAYNAVIPSISALIDSSQKPEGWFRRTMRVGMQAGKKAVGGLAVAGGAAVGGLAVAGGAVVNTLAEAISTRRADYQRRLELLEPLKKALEEFCVPDDVEKRELVNRWSGGKTAQRLNQSFATITVYVGEDTISFTANDEGKLQLSDQGKTFNNVGEVLAYLKEKCNALPYQEAQQKALARKAAANPQMVQADALFKFGTETRDVVVRKLEAVCGPEDIAIACWPWKDGEDRYLSMTINGEVKHVRLNFWASEGKIFAEDLSDPRQRVEITTEVTSKSSGGVIARKIAKEVYGIADTSKEIWGRERISKATEANRLQAKLDAWEVGILKDLKGLYSGSWYSRKYFLGEEIEKKSLIGLAKEINQQVALLYEEQDGTLKLAIAEPNGEFQDREFDLHPEEGYFSFGEDRTIYVKASQFQEVLLSNAKTVTEARTLAEELRAQGAAFVPVGEEFAEEEEAKEVPVAAVPQKPQPALPKVKAVPVSVPEPALAPAPAEKKEAVAVASAPQQPEFEVREPGDKRLKDSFNRAAEAGKLQEWLEEQHLEAEEFVWLAWQYLAWQKESPKFKEAQNAIVEAIVQKKDPRLALALQQYKGKSRKAASLLKVHKQKLGLT